MKFEYIEVNKKGLKIKDTITALSQKDALKILQKEGKIIASIKEVKEHILFKTIILNKDKLIAKFTESLTNMLSAGIPLMECLEIMYQEEKMPYMKNIIREIMVELKKGKSFSKAIMGFSLFSSLYGAMIRVGEETGKLKEVLKQLQDDTLKRVELREKIMSSLYYPFFLMMLSGATLMYLVLYVLPQLFQIFEGFDAKLPTMTLMLMGFIHFLQSYFLVILGVIIVVVYLLLQYIKKDKGYEAMERFLLKIPKVNTLYRVILNINFFKPLNLLLKNKVNLDTSLEIINQTVKSIILKKLIDNILFTLKKGQGIIPGKEGDLLFAVSTIQMLHIGERSGKLSVIIENLERQISEKSEQDIRRIIVLIEPVFILVVGLVIGFIVLSALLPIYSLSTMVKP